MLVPIGTVSDFDVLGVGLNVLEFTSRENFDQLQCYRLLSSIGSQQAFTVAATVPCQNPFGSFYKSLKLYQEIPPIRLIRDWKAQLYASWPLGLLLVYCWPAAQLTNLHHWKFKLSNGLHVTLFSHGWKLGVFIQLQRLRIKLLKLIDKVLSWVDLNLLKWELLWILYHAS